MKYALGLIADTNLSSNVSMTISLYKTLNTFIFTLPIDITKSFEITFLKILSYGQNHGKYQ